MNRVASKIYEDVWKTKRFLVENNRDVKNIIILVDRDIYNRLKDECKFLHDMTRDEAKFCEYPLIECHHIEGYKVLTEVY